MAANFRLLAPLFIFSILPAGALAQAQNHVSDFRARFAQESDAMHRAEVMPKIGQAEFDEITRNFDENNLPEALEILQEYTDEIDTCEKALDARKIDAAKHPKGYKQLQISLRQSLRKLNRLIVSLTVDEQAPFTEIREHLEDLNRHLIRELFPSAPSDDNTPPD